MISFLKPRCQAFASLKWYPLNLTHTWGFRTTHTSGFSIDGAIASPLPPLTHQPFLAVQLHRCHPAPCLCMQLFLQKKGWLKLWLIAIWSNYGRLKFAMGFMLSHYICSCWCYETLDTSVAGFAHLLTSSHILPGKSGSQAGLGLETRGWSYDGELARTW